MKNENIVEIFPGAYLDIEAYISAKPAKIVDPLTRHDNFVRGTNIYILDSFASKTNMKNAAFVRRIKDAIADAHDMANRVVMDIIPINWKIAPDWDRPHIHVYVDCPDATLTNYSRAALAELARATTAGVKITVHVIGNHDSAIARGLLAMEKFSANRTSHQTTTKQR